MNEAIQSTSGTVKFRLKNVKSKNPTSIFLDYNFGSGNRLKYATGYKILPKHWDKNNQRVRAVSTITNREQINNNLKSYEAKFIKSVSGLSDADKQDRDKLKELLDHIIRSKDVKVKDALSFFEFADKYIETKKKQLNDVKSVKLSPITLRSYNQSISRLKDFDTETNFKLDFHNIDLKFYYAFISFLEEKDYSLNTIGKHIKNLIALLNRATEEGDNTNLKYKHRDFKTITENTTSIYLTPKEIEDIYNLDLTKNEDWQLARDIFIIGYYTGQRVSDYNGLIKEQIKIFDGQAVLEIHQKKTKKTIYIPIHKRIKKIVKDRYNGAFPPKLSDQKINEYIKFVGRKAKITELVNVKKTTGGVLNGKNISKHKLIGTHTARRSFCTNAYLSKMPVIDIMSISGHTTEREFYKYIKVTPQERAVKIADSAFFK